MTELLDDGAEVVRAKGPVRDTNPHGWTDHRWLAETYALVCETKAAIERVEKRVEFVANGLVTVNQNVVASHKKTVESLETMSRGMADIRRRASDSQVAAEEARAKATANEGHLVEAFVEEAKPFTGKKIGGYAAAVVVGAATMLAGSYLVHQCGIDAPPEIPHVQDHHH